MFTLAEAKQHLNLDDTTDDDELSTWFDAVTEYVERYTGNTYTGADAIEVPASHKGAALIILSHLWDTQRGTMPTDEFSAPVGMGYAVPNRAKELLGAPLPGIA